VAWLLSPCIPSRNVIPTGSCGQLGGAPLAQAVAAELDAVGIVNDAIEDGVGQGGITEYLRVPLFRID
jgi:hypothetical protein